MSTKRTNNLGLDKMPWSLLLQIFLINVKNHSLIFIVLSNKFITKLERSRRDNITYISVLGVSCPGK